MESRVEFQYVKDGPLPAATKLTLNKTTALTAAAFPPVPWLKIEPRGRSLSLSIIPDGVDAGQYATTIDVEPAASGEPRTLVPVQLIVKPAPTPPPKDPPRKIET